jgi:hypothetical protein
MYRVRIVRSTSANNHNQNCDEVIEEQLTKGFEVVKTTHLMDEESTYMLVTFIDFKTKNG